MGLLVFFFQRTGEGLLIGSWVIPKQLYHYDDAPILGDNFMEAAPES